MFINFHPALSGVGKIVDSLWPILQASDDVRQVFKEKPLVSYRRPRNLKDKLVGAKFKDQIDLVREMKKCGKARCQMCKLVEEGSTFRGKNKVFSINHAPDCDSKGVVYMSICKRCEKLYVSSTVRCFRKRFNNHKSSLQ